MNEKTLQTLEFTKIRNTLTGFASFSASAELAARIRPTRDIALAGTWQRQTTEARWLLSSNFEISVSGMEDIRKQCDLATRGGVLLPEDFLLIKQSLIIARDTLRQLEKYRDELPEILQVVSGLQIPSGVIEQISKTISDHGDILDVASDRLADIRRDVKICHDRLLSKLERMVNDPRNGPMLQEPIITQRDGRYVIPLRSEYKGQIKSIVHDQSSSGATLFVEPLAVMELNNQFRELQLAERDEERRILTELTQVISIAGEEIRQVVNVIAEFDFILARAKYADSLSASEPILVPIKRRKDEGHPGSTIQLIRARHPLLDPAQVVPIDLELDQDTFSLIITGPNTGGKTVTLKTVGLLAVMAQSGLHIPALSGSKISVFDDIFADIGDEQSIEQSLSTFSGHITNIIQILKKADSYSLVLLDELGAGTDPQEGAALAMAIVTHLIDQQVTCLVATHYPELKAFAHNTRHVINASLEFDLQTLKPTYHLLLGLPGRSNALSIAERLGLPESIISLARGTIHPDELRSEDLLDEIYRQRSAAREAREAAESAQKQATALEKEWRVKAEQIELEREKYLDSARIKAEDELYELKREIEEIRKEMARLKMPLDEVKGLQQKTKDVEVIADAITESKTRSKPVQKAEIKKGTRVIIGSLGMQGIVEEISGDEAEVLVGRLHMRARVAELRRTREVEPEKPMLVKPAKKTSSPAPARTTMMELDLRGERAEDALDRVDRYLDEAYSNGMPFVRIIHGKGTGRLRQVIREALRASSLVKRFETGMESEGGDGVTVVHLNTD